MASHLKTLQLLLTLLLSSCIIFIKGQKIVTTHKGPVKGTTVTTRNGRSIEAYLGIPYAQPPLGPLRFTVPQELDDWSDVRDATIDAYQCPQLNEANEVVGDEDCLYLNVYTPQSGNKGSLLATMLYLHDGDYVKGNSSSAMYGAQYILDRDVILVTMNYRLGVLGFLSTASDEALGNYGMKDQVCVLKWIRDNIEFFGGDKNRVTIFGSGSGGASAQLHAFSPLSTGLFHQYISQSGSALCFWTFVTRSESRDIALKLGEYLQCPTYNEEALVECLRQTDLNRLVDSNEIFSKEFYHFETWTPTKESTAPGSFLEWAPNDRVVGTAKNYPSMIGQVVNEGLLFTAPFYVDDEKYEEVVNNFDEFLVNIIRVSFEPENPTKYLVPIKKLYFNGTVMEHKRTILQSITDLLSDTTYFISGAYIDQSLVIPWHNYTAYLYSFNYRGTFSGTSNVIGSNKNIGVTHNDELIYLFPTNPEQFNEPSLKFSKSDEQMIDIMLDLWTSFASTGTPSTKQFPDLHIKPYGSGETILMIGDNTNTSTIEPEHRGAFLVRHPYFQVQHGLNVQRSIIGHVADEGLMLTAQYYTDTRLYEKVANNLNKFIRHVLDALHNFRIPEEFVERTREFYFNGTKLSDRKMFTENMTSFISDTFFLHAADEIVYTMSVSWNTTVYFYSFAYRGTFSETSQIIGSNENIGVSHGDDITYFFPSTERFNRSESDEEIIDTMMDLWTSFADTGIPSTKTFPERKFWKTYGDNRDYLKIGNNSDPSLSQDDHFDWEGLDFLAYQVVDATVGSYLRNVLGVR